MDYKEELIKSMKFLAQDPKTIFLGQGVCYKGHVIYETVRDIERSQRLELPVAEELQLGMSIGLSLKGYIPVSIFPRVNFIWRAADQLINHLDKMEEMSHGEWKPFIIIRTMNGSTDPLDPGPQHKGDYTDALKAATSRVMVIKLREPEQIFRTYKWLYESRKSAVVIELPQ